MSVPGDSRIKGLLMAAGIALMLGAGIARASEFNTVLLGAADALRAGEAGEAAELYTRVIQADRAAPIDRAYALLNRGIAYQRLNRPDHAVADFTNAIWLKALPPHDFARALFNRGVVRDEQGRIELAIADYSAALDLVPGFAEALNNRANAYRRLGDFERARADYQASLVNKNAAPEYPLYGLGLVEEAAGNGAAALGFYERALDTNAGFTLAAERIRALRGGTTPASFELAAPRRRPAVPPVAAVRDERRIALLGSQPPDLRPAIREPQRRAGAGLVQIGSFREAAMAHAGFGKVAAAAGGLLDGMRPDVVAVDIPERGRFYRLRAGPVPEGHDAKSLCSALKARGLDCLPVAD